MSRSEVTRSFLRIDSGLGPIITFVESPQQRTQRVNSTAVTANDTAVRLRSLRKLDCSLVAVGANDSLHLVRAPNALAFVGASGNEMILIETEDGVQRMTVYEMFDALETLKGCVG